MAGAWKAGGRAEGPPQESRELPAKKAEALLTLMSRPLHLLCPNPNLDLDLEREASGFGAEAEVPGAAVWSLSLLVSDNHPYFSEESQILSFL